MSKQEPKNFNERHRIIYDTVLALGRATVYQIHNECKIKPLTISNYVYQMVDKGLLERHPVKGKARYTYTPTEMTFEEFEQLFKIPKEPIPDPLLRATETYELTDAQWKFIKDNPGLSRSCLVEKLGIPRTILLAAIERRRERERGKKG